MYIRMFDHVTCTKGFSQVEKVVYCYIATQIDNEGSCNHSYQLIADNIGGSVSSIKRAVKSLQHKKLLVIIKGEEGSANSYQINPWPMDDYEKLKATGHFSMY